MRMTSLFRKAVNLRIQAGPRSKRCFSHGGRRLGWESLEERRMLAVNVAVVDNGDDSAFAAIVGQLNDNTHGFGFTATLVQPTDLDTTAELDAYDVVVLGADGINADSFPIIAPALRNWVENRDGGVVGVGFAAFGIRNGLVDDLDAILPVAIIGSSETFEGPGSVLEIDPGDPVTNGVNHIHVAPVNFFESIAPPADTWGTVLGDFASGNLGVVLGAVPTGLDPGRAVYLGPNYAGASAQYNTADLRSGDADRLLEQAVNWAANVTSPVTVLVDGNGNLVIEGTSEDDTVTITGIGAGTGNYLITTRQGTGTVFSFPVMGVNGGFNINLHAGNDQLTINNALVNGAIDIQLEAGQDTVILGNQDVVSTGTELRVDLGAGNDTLNGKRLYIGTNQLIQCGDGNDSLIFEGVASPQFTLSTSAAGFAFWSGGAGDDTVRVVYAFVVKSWGVFLGDGADALNLFGSAGSGDVILSGDAGDDNLTVDTNFFDATMVINGLGGADTIFLANGLGTELAFLTSGDGNDSLTVRNQTTKDLRMDAGTGSDDADVQGSAFDRVFALLGDDNDELTVRGNLVQVETLLDGGAGASDRLFDLGNVFRGVSRRQGFEV
jgi:hypothetical protein